MNEVLLFQCSIVFFLCGSIGSILTGFFSKKMSLITSGVCGVIGSILGIYSSVLVLIQQSTFTFVIPLLKIPFVSLDFTVDPLAGLFIVIITLAVFPLSIYAFGYLKSEYIQKEVGLMGGLFHLFIVSMLLVVTASNVLMFLIFWECMALLSFCLVIFDIDSPQSYQAGMLYLIMTHMGTAFILGLYLILIYNSGDFTFGSFTANAFTMSPDLKGLLFIFAVVGFGTKAGLIPFHLWLPEAHPAAPTHVSALMSGVMLKIAVYGFIRCVYDFLIPLPVWCGITLALVGLITAILGIVYASAEEDLKRLLAYSSIENMGIIFFALGTSLSLADTYHSLWAKLFIVGALLHSLNHSIFKCLLFMVTGAILSMTHTRSLQDLGGLIKKMPVTALLFLIGALAVSAFPPLNGFLSEWIILQGLILATSNISGFLNIFCPLSAALLGFVGILVAATFLKAFTGIFLALPRTNKTDHAQEVSITMHIGMIILAILCFIIGGVPACTLPLLSKTSDYILHIANAQASPLLKNNFTVLLDEFTSYSPLFIIFFLILGGCIAFFIPQLFGKKMLLRKDITWSCGVTPSAEFEYTPTGFIQPLNLALSKFYVTKDFYHAYLYVPIIKGILFISKGISMIQMGNIQVYLLYILVTLILCLWWIK